MILLHNFLFFLSKRLQFFFKVFFLIQKSISNFLHQEFSSFLSISSLRMLHIQFEHQNIALLASHHNVLHPIHLNLNVPYLILVSALISVLLSSANHSVLRQKEPNARQRKRCVYLSRYKIKQNICFKNKSFSNKLQEVNFLVNYHFLPNLQIMKL